MKVAAIVSNPVGSKLLSPETTFYAQLTAPFESETSLQPLMIPLTLNISTAEISVSVLRTEVLTVDLVAVSQTA
jgi:hypothetical protein